VAKQGRDGTYDFLLCEEARCHSLLPIGEYVGGWMGSVAFAVCKERISSPGSRCSKGASNPQKQAGVIHAQQVKR
jgi:hypothetical protein